MTWIEDLARRFRLSDLATETLEEISRVVREEKATIVFALRRPSHIEPAIIRQLCGIRGLPLPEGDLVSNGDGTATFLFLRRRLLSDSFRYLANRYRHRLEKRLSLLKHRQTSRPIYVVPCALFAGLGPRPWPPHFTAPIDSSFFPIYDLWESLRYFYFKRSLTLDLGPLMELDTKLPARTELRQLSKELYRKEKSVRGPRTPKGSKVEQIVLSGEGFDKALEQIAVHESLSRYEVTEKARSAFREIAGQISGGVVEFFRLVLAPTVKRLFKHTDVRGLEHIRTACAQGPVVLVSTHRSHFDYLLHGFTLYSHGLPLPYIAAGKNLDFFPAGPLLRRSGAFFIRRKIENDPLYKVVLERYLSYLIKQGHLIEFYIEGGRSRSGHTLTPRFGLLKTIIRSLSRGERRDILLVPAAVSYERVPEDRSLARERFGASKIKENILSLVKARSVYSKRFGPAFIRFGPPVSLRQALKLNGDQGEAATRLPSSQPPSSRARSSQAPSSREIEKLGEEISHSLNELQALTCAALFSTAALMAEAPLADSSESGDITPSCALSSSEISQSIDAILRAIAIGKGYGTACNSDFFRGRSWETSEREFCGIALAPGVSQLLDADLRHDAVSEQCERFASTHEIEFTDDLLRPQGEDWVVLDFYRNSLLPRIFQPATIALPHLPHLHRWFGELLHLTEPALSELPDGLRQSEFPVDLLIRWRQFLNQHVAALSVAAEFVSASLEASQAVDILAFKREVNPQIIKQLRQNKLLRPDAQTDTMAEFVSQVFQRELFTSRTEIPADDGRAWKELVRERMQSLRTVLAQLYLAIGIKSEKSAISHEAKQSDYLIHSNN